MDFNDANFFSSHYVDSDKSIQFMSRLFWQLMAVFIELVQNERYSCYFNEYISGV